MDIDEALIEEVKANECLYDLSSASYKNVVAKEKIWAEIGRRLRLDGATCKKRWKTLRDTHRRIKRSNILSSGSAAPTCKRFWRHHATMGFLDRVQSYRKTTTNMVELEEDRCDSPPLELKTLFESTASAPPLPLPTPSASTATVPPSPSPSTPLPLSSPSASIATALPSPSPSTLKKRAKKNKPQEELGAFLAKIADSAKEATQIFTQRAQLPAQTPVASYFAGLAHIVDAAGMPDERVQSVLHDAHIAVFNALREWSTRNNKSN